MFCDVDMATSSISICKPKLVKRKADAGVKQDVNKSVIEDLPAIKKHKHDASVSSSSSATIPTTAAAAAPVVGGSVVFPWTGQIKTVDELVDGFTNMVKWCEGHSKQPGTLANNDRVEQCIRSSIHPEFPLLSVNAFAYLALRLDEVCHRVQTDPLWWKVYVGVAQHFLRSIAALKKVQCVSLSDYRRVCICIRLFTDELYQTNSLRKFPDGLFQPLFNGVFTPPTSNDASLLQACVNLPRLIACMPPLMRLLPHHKWYGIWSFIEFAKQHVAYYRKYPSMLIDTLNFIPSPFCESRITNNQRQEFFTACAWKRRDLCFELLSALSRFTSPIPWEQHVAGHEAALKRTGGVGLPPIGGVRIVLPIPTTVHPCLTEGDHNIMKKSTELYTARYVTPYVRLITDASKLASDSTRLVIGYILPLADTIFIPWMESLVPRYPAQLSVIPFFKECVHLGPTHGQFGIFKSSDHPGDAFVVLFGGDYPYALTVLVPALRKAAGIASPIEFGRDRSVFCLDDTASPAVNSDATFGAKTVVAALYAPIVIFPLTEGHTLADLVDFPTATDQPIVDRPLSLKFERDYVTRMSASWHHRQRHLRSKLNLSLVMS